MIKIKTLLLTLLLCMAITGTAITDTWKVTAYCACKLCCGPKAKGITASGKHVRYGYVACNWLPYGTRIHIDTMGNYIVMDHGARSQFGDSTHHIKHVDVYIPNHKTAKKFGVKYLAVTIK